MKYSKVLHNKKLNSASLLKLSSNVDLSPRVSILDFSQKKDLEYLKGLYDHDQIFSVSDTLLDQLCELYQIRNPSLKKGTEEFDKGLENFKIRTLGKDSSSNLQKYGSWVFLPWRGALIHILPSDIYFELRTNRNRNVLTTKEQKIYANFNVGVCGLSVGNSIALSIALTGGSRTMKLADYDYLSLSNMNRIRSSIADIGLNKSYLAARQIYEIDPYSELLTYPAGINADNLEGFIAGKPKLNVVIDAIDDLSLKVLLRVLAKKHKIPVVMATDCGEGVLLDVERYDISPDTQMFNGRVDSTLTDKILKGRIQGKERLLTVSKIVGLENVSVRKTDSLLEIGKSLYTWPQLGSSVELCGVATSMAVQKLALGIPISKSSFIPLGQFLMSNRGKDEVERSEAAVRFYKNLS